MNENGLYQIDSGYACAGVFVKDGIIVYAAPIFRKLIGQRLDTVRYKKTKCTALVD